GEAARGPAMRKLILSDQARRYLALQYRSYSTEFMGCMIGETHGSAVVVRRIAPADVEPSHSTATRVVPHQTCEDAGWSGTIGMIHSHPGGERCWYFFPGTQVASSDGQSFASQPYPVDAIMCGDHVTWINRDMAEAQLPLVADTVRAPVLPRLRGRARRQLRTPSLGGPRCDCYDWATRRPCEGAARWGSPPQSQDPGRLERCRRDSQAP